jgi:hypothetical protein
MGRLWLTMAVVLQAFFLIETRIERIAWLFSSRAIPFIGLSLSITVLAVASVVMPDGIYLHGLDFLPHRVMDGG